MVASKPATDLSRDHWAEQAARMAGQESLKRYKHRAKCRTPLKGHHQHYSIHLASELAASNNDALNLQHPRLATQISKDMRGQSLLSLGSPSRLVFLILNNNYLPSITCERSKNSSMFVDSLVGNELGRRQNSCRKHRRRRLYSSQYRMILLVTSIIAISLGLLFVPIKASHLRQEDELQPVSNLPAAFHDEPEPLVYLALHESGSGDGSSAYSVRSSQRPDLSAVSSDGPSLIAAKCWNNYENDNDCKQINVITAPNQNELNRPTVDDDSLITPVVIFESASSIEPTPVESSASGQQSSFLAPPYFSSTSKQDISNVVLSRHRISPTANDVYAAPPAGATRLYPDQVSYTPRSTTNTPTKASVQPSVTRSPGLVATPSPKRPSAKSTTAGRKCRDENDADCDEPDDDNSPDTGEDNETSSISSNDKVTDDDIDDDNNSGGRRRLQQNNKNQYDNNSANEEFGSGDGPQDDNESDTDDDDDGDPDGNQSENSGRMEVPSEPPTTRYVDVSSTSGLPDTRANGQATESAESTTSSTKPGAEIEVVVHPTLPPTFPQTTAGGPSTFDPSTSNDITMPDDTFKSKPVFPVSPESQPGPTDNNMISGGFPETPESGNSAEDTSSEPDSNSVTTEIDLATYRPVPMPQEENNNINSNNNNNVNNNNLRNRLKDTNKEQDGDKLADRFRFRGHPVASQSSYQKFDNPWIAQPKRPLSQVASQEDQWRNGPDLPARSASNQIGNRVMESNQPIQHMKPDMLPTLLLYASVIILAVTALIFIIMALTFWRRNTARRRVLLQKSQLVGPPNGHMMRPGGGNQHMVTSMSQASQLMTNAPQQPCLLSTYSPGKMGKITSSLMKAPEQDVIMEEEDEGNVMEQVQPSRDLVLDHGGPMVRQPSQQVTNASWSTEEPATSSGSGSQITADSQQQIAANQRWHQQPPVQYPNSFSEAWYV